MDFSWYNNTIGFITSNEINMLSKKIILSLVGSLLVLFTTCNAQVHEPGQKFTLKTDIDSLFNVFDEAKNQCSNEATALKAERNSTIEIKSVLDNSYVVLVRQAYWAKDEAGKIYEDQIIVGGIYCIPKDNFDELFLTAKKRLFGGFRRLVD